MIKGKIAIVTGGGRGIGAATAELFAHEGAEVIVVSRTQAEIDSVAKSLRALGLLCHAIKTNVASEEEVRFLFEKIASSIGPLDILVNCAATIERVPFETLTLRTWKEIQDINTTGTFLCCREAVRQMKGRGGDIVNVSSLGGISGTEKFPGYSAYTTSKYAVAGLTEALAVETLPLGIRVNCIAPGAVETAMLRKAAPGLRTKTTAADIAKIIFFLADRISIGELKRLGTARA